MIGERILAIDIGDAVEFPSTALQANAVRSVADGFYRTLTRPTGGNSATGYSRLNWRDRGRVYLRFKIATLANNGAMVGVVKTSEATAGTYLGNTAGSWACWTSGQLLNNGVVSAASAFATGDYVELAWDASLRYLWFGKNGTWFASGDPANGLNPSYTGVSGLLDLAVTLYGQGTVVTIIADETACRATCPVGFTPAGILARIGSKGFATAPNDTPGSAYYDGRLAADGDPVYARAVSCFIWDRGQAQRAPLGDIELINIDGGLDYWANYDLSKMPVRLRIGYEGQMLTAFADAALATIDRAEDVSDERLRLVLTDPGAKNDRPLGVGAFTATPNTSLVNTPVPYVLGTVKWTTPPQSDPANLEYPVHDGPNGGIYEVRDQGVVITPSTGWSFGVRTDAAGLRRLTNPAGRNAVALRGGVILTGLSQSFDFTQAGNWTGDNPTGWVLGFTEDASNKITFNAGAQFLCNGGTTVIMERGTGTYGTNGTIGAGALYWFEITATVTGGQLEVQALGGSATDLGQTVLAVMKGSGTLRFGISCIGTSAIRLAVNKAAGVNVTVQSFKMYNATLIERLPDVLTELCVTRGSLFAKDLDTTGTIAAVDAAFPAKFGLYADQAARIPELLKAITDSILGWYWFNRLGLMKVGRLLDPAAQQPIAFFNDTNVIGPIQRMRDRAPGLSDSVAGQRNFSPHNTAELAGSVLPTTASGDLQAEYLVKKVGAGALASAYQFAKGGKALPTLLTDPTHVQALASLLTTLYGKDRFFYPFTAAMDEDVPRTNLLLQSQAFTQSPWVATFATVTDNAVVSPLGQVFAATLQDANVSQFGRITQVVTIPADTTTYTFSIYVKKTTGGTSATFGVNLDIAGGTAVSLAPRLNTDTGALLAGAAGSSVWDAGTYWRLVTTISNNGTAGNTSLTVGVYPATNTYNGAVNNAAATGTAAIWGGQLEVGTTASPYIWTTTAPALSPRSYTLEPSDVIALATDQTKRFGLTGGKNLLVISAEGRFLSNTVDIVAWG